MNECARTPCWIAQAARESVWEKSWALLSILYDRSNSLYRVIHFVISRLNINVYNAVKKIIFGKTLFF